jgi:hypothetical protein
MHSFHRGGETIQTKVAELIVKLTGIMGLVKGLRWVTTSPIRGTRLVQVAFRAGT